MAVKNLKGIETEFETLKQLAYHVLKKYPVTRNNDEVLYCYCCKLLGAESIYEIIDLQLSMSGIQRVRRKIQNQENKFTPIDTVKHFREKREDGIKEYMKNEDRKR